MKTVGIINPNSRGGKTAKRFPQLRDLFEKSGIRGIDWQFTKHPRHATALTREALQQGAETVISAGGDGTHSEVINGFFDESGEVIAPNAAFALLHQGTGGDLRKTFRISKDPHSAIRAILHGSRKKIDVGHVEFTDFQGQPAGTHFINVLSMGISGEVNRNVKQSPRLKRISGKAVFIWSTIRALLSFSNPSLSVRLDGNPPQQGKFANLAIANGRFFGGGMHIAPHARLESGVFDVVGIGDYGLLGFLTKAKRLYAGTHLELDKVWSRNARSVEVSSCSKVLMDVDGEIPGHLPIRVTIKEKAITAIMGDYEIQSQ